jgi:hypothetical protein
MMLDWNEYRKQLAAGVREIGRPRHREESFTPNFSSPPVDHRRLIVEWLTL